MSPFLVAYYLSGARSNIKDRMVSFDDKRYTQEKFAAHVRYTDGFFNIEF